ncbi:MAG: cysteine desulfurase [Myxococcales bacterium]|nr:cysteine desulfurase [Myxococcales bacterium]
MSFDVAALRAQFPALEQRVNGRPLVYLDSAATALKPRRVIEAVESVYAADCANIHRAVHALSQRATARYEGARDVAVRFLNAKSRAEVVYTRGTTEGINLVAQTWGLEHLREGDEILLTELEHHSNIVPWQLVAARTGAKIVVVPITDVGEVSLEDVEARLSSRTKIVSVAHASNALGTVLPVKEIAERAHAVGAIVVVDGAQGAPHLPVDVQALGCDFYAFSGHKIYGPSGIGILWGKEALLDAMPPYQGGGDMIDHVSFSGSTWNELPYKFEAGTPPIASAIGLGEALQFFMELDHEALFAHEQDVLAYAMERLASIPGVTLVGTAKQKVAVQSFLVEGAHPSDVGTILDGFGVAVRTGHHCAQPVMERFCIPATARASFGLYNTREDVDALIEGLEQVQRLFGNA